METLTCELVSESTGEKINCPVKKTEPSSQCEISYQATIRGRYQLHIKVEEEHIKGSPFPVTLKLPVQKLGTPIKTISGVKGPWGVAVNKRGETAVAEESGHCIFIFSPTGDKFQSFGSQGSGNGHFNCPRSVVVDDDGNILVADSGNNRIYKFTSAVKFIKTVGNGGNKLLEFFDPFGNNHCIRVFTAKGQFLRKFGKKGSGNGDLNCPTSISIDSENVVYVAEEENHCISVFTCEGKFLTSFGSKGSGPGQFRYPCGIAVDKNRVVYVSECGDNHIQLF